MRILQVHNQYFSGLGGEDTVLRLEHDLLRAHGHEVRQWFVSTAQLQGAGIAQLAEAAADTVWSRSSYNAVAAEVRSFRPDVVHVHNTFPLASPSVYYAARRNGAPVVQTLHNYRLSCVNGLLLRNNVPCEDCVGKSKLPGLLHRCYHGNLGLSASMVAMQTVHRARHTFQRQVDAYIALTGFQRDLTLREGIPAELVHVKPNFMLPPAGPTPPPQRKQQITFVGNFREMKGIDLLLEAWARLNPAQHRLLLFGHGPARERLERQYAGHPSIDWIGTQPSSTVLQTLAESQYLALCSRWYEGFPMVILEAFSVGTPAILPNHGAFPSILDGRGGALLFQPGDVSSLAETITRALALPQQDWQTLSQQARTIAQSYNPEDNYTRLLQIYTAAIDHYRRTRPQPRRA